MILGMGLSGKATFEEARALLRGMGIVPGTVIAVPAFRASHPVVDALYRAGYPVIALHPAQLNGIVTPSQSERIHALYGTGCLAEACALWACGHGARLSIERTVSPQGHITAALAVSPEPENPQGVCG